ncbi:MAG: ATP-binding cassette domain-containing protein [Ignavibacteriales bacterium]|nr:MAG: ATP-binding cassette domain-containing protein [Ignavibacteriales bacterium]
MVEIKNLSKAFGKNIVLDNISLDITEGDNAVVFGRSGTGKSVLLKCIARLLDPDSGEIFVDGKDVLKLEMKELNELRKNIGFLFQSAALYDSMTVRENLEFPLIRNFDFSPKEREDKIKNVLKKVGLEKSIDMMPAELSGGMKKRIGLARTIITEPKLILYDEPTTGLDPITVKEISNLIVELQEDINATSIVVTHDIICAQIVSDHAIVIKDAQIIFEGKLNEVVSQDDEFLKNFFTTENLTAKNGSLNG